MVFTFSLRAQTALVKYNAQQSMRLRVTWIYRNYLSSGRLRFFKSARLQEPGSFRKFGGLTVASRNLFAGFRSPRSRRLRVKPRRCNQNRNSRSG
ncbi:MAG: hypothetical protein QOD75_1420 [Blastocatellia bacterium]|nr:hypothetical protein [Blastocatellia bacterium]